MAETRPGRARLAELALVGIAAIWGATFVLVQDAVRLLPVFTFLAWRFLLAPAVVLPFTVRDLLALPRPGGERGSWSGSR